MVFHLFFEILPVFQKFTAFLEKKIYWAISKKSHQLFWLVHGVRVFARQAYKTQSAYRFPFSVLVLVATTLQIKSPEQEKLEFCRR
jgi:hypothetical protein